MITLLEFFPEEYLDYVHSCLKSIIALKSGNTASTLNLSAHILDISALHSIYVNEVMCRHTLL